jgi:hypothetical protein
VIESRAFQEAYAPRDESAALQWAVETFRRNAFCFDPDYAGKRLAYNKQLLLHMKVMVETIQHAGGQSIVVPESTAELHRIDPDELLDLIAKARESDIVREYLLAVAAALIDNKHTLPEPLKEFAAQFLRNPKTPQPSRGRPVLHRRDNVISWAIAMICIQWEFSPTRNEVTEEASAISIVKKALGEIRVHLTEAAITKIWNKSGSWKESVEGWCADQKGRLERNGGATERSPISRIRRARQGAAMREQINVRRLR